METAPRILVRRLLSRVYQADWSQRLVPLLTPPITLRGDWEEDLCSSQRLFCDGLIPLA